MRAVRRLFFVATVASLFAAAPAAAEPTPADAVLAETLFREGKELMAAKQFATACPKLAESNRLDPGTGTLLALGLCHEGEGRIATAWIEFTDVLAASGDARPDRALVAREHIARIEPALSKLTVVVPPSLARVPGLIVLRDDVRLDRAAWDTAVPIDGGPHTVEARGDNRRAWNVHFNVAATGERRTIELPGSLPLSGDPILDTPSQLVHRADAARATPTDLVRMRWGIALGAIGLAAIGTGAYFGVSAITKIHQAKSECPAATCTSQSPLDLNAEGLRDATVADVALGAGLLVGAVGLFLALTARGHAGAPGLGFRVVPALDRGGGSVTLSHSL